MIAQEPPLLLTHGGEARCAKIYNFYKKCQALTQLDPQQKLQWNQAFQQIKRAATTIGFRFQT